MECKFCHASIEDDAKFCPVCGKSLTDAEETEPVAEAAAQTVEELAQDVAGAAEEAAEAAAEETAEAEQTAEAVEGAAEEAAEAAAEETAEAEQTAEAVEGVEDAPVSEDELIPGDPTGKPKKGHGALYAVLAVLCVLIAAAAVLYTNLNKLTKIPSERVVLSGAKSYTVANDALTDEIANTVVASSRKIDLLQVAKDKLGKTEPEKDGLTNAQLSLFYWENFYNYYNQNYYYAMYLGLDPVHMDTSMYDEEAKRSWQEYFLTNALEDYRTYTAACEKATAEGFKLPDDVAENLKTIRENVASRSDEELSKQLLSVYGPGVDRAAYLAYLEKLFLGASYIQAMQEKIEPTDEELSAYYDAHIDEYESVPKDDTGTVNVRHVLISPTDTDDVNAWKAAEEKANKLYEEWKAGEITEESFAELAKANSEDPGSVENGGLYEDVYPGQMVETFNDWCFDAARKPGDTGVVKTDYGFHIMYFVSAGETAYWKTAVREACQRELLTKHVDEMALAYNLRLDLDKIALATPGQILESVDESQSETAEEPAAEPAADAATEPAAEAATEPAPVG